MHWEWECEHFSLTYYRSPMKSIDSLSTTLISAGKHLEATSYPKLQPFRSKPQTPSGDASSSQHWELFSRWMPVHLTRFSYLRVREALRYPFYLPPPETLPLRLLQTLASLSNKPARFQASALSNRRTARLQWMLGRMLCHLFRERRPSLLYPSDS